MTSLPKNPDGTVTINGHVFASHNQTCIHCGMTLVDYKDGPRRARENPQTKKFPLKIDFRASYSRSAFPNSSGSRAMFAAMRRASSGAPRRDTYRPGSRRGVV
jgi:hypothetical protein